MVYKGDHYQLIVRTEDEDDFVVDTEWTWNEFDKVSVKIDPSKIKLMLKGDLSKYEILYCAIYATNETQKMVDFNIQQAPKPAPQQPAQPAKK